MPLWIVATPIGTLSDLSPRAREVLGSAAVIAAEDTRTTRKLLGAVDVAAPEIVALHAHNESQRADALVERAAAEDVVLVTDAGTPAISDPGTLLVARCRLAGVRVLSVPGPSALAAALAASGLSAIPSTFLGFAPRKGRGRWVEAALARADTLVIFEAPGRVAGLVADLAAGAPDRAVCVLREVSKRFEEGVSGSLAAVAAELGARDGIKGECVVVVGPGEASPPRRETVDPDGGLKSVAAVLAERWGVSRRDAYQRLLALERDATDG